MIYKLAIHLTNIQHPYPDEPEAPQEAWGQIIIEVMNGLEKQRLFSTQWDLALLAEWFINNRDAICKEHLVVGNETAQPLESLSQALARFYDREFEDAFDVKSVVWFETLDNYVSSHCLWYALMGSKTPNIIIGCHNTEGEISLYDKQHNWGYRFNMIDFVESFQKEIRHFIEVWVSSTKHPSAMNRARNILEKITLSSAGCCENKV